MIRTMIRGLLFISAGVSAQSTEPQIDPNETMEEAMSEISKYLDTIDFANIFEGDQMNELFKGFGFGGQDMQGMMDSLGISEMFGGDFSEMFGGGQLPGLEGMDMEQLDKMMQESLSLIHI